MHIGEERQQHRSHASDDDDIGLEQIDDVAQPDRQQHDGLEQNLVGKSIASRIGLTNEFAGHGVQVAIGKLPQHGVSPGPLRELVLRLSDGRASRQGFLDAPRACRRRQGGRGNRCLMSTFAPAAPVRP